MKNPAITPAAAIFPSPARPKNKYGNLDDEVTREGWTGYRILKSGNDSILYAKHETMHGIYEELDISTEELVDYTMGEEGVIEDNI